MTGFKSELSNLRTSTSLLSHVKSYPKQYRIHVLRTYYVRFTPKSATGWSLDVPYTELLLLPDHLRQTYLTVASRGECDATVVSNLTGRCRPVESNYLNQLARMGWLNKRRVSKTACFRPVSEKVQNKPTLFRSKRLGTY